MSRRKPVRKGDVFPEPTKGDPNPDPCLTALGPCFLQAVGKKKRNGQLQKKAFVYCRCSCGGVGASKRKLYEVSQIRRNKRTGQPNTRSCGCYRTQVGAQNYEKLSAWRKKQPSKWPLKRLRTKRILKNVEILDKRSDAAVIKQEDRIKVRCKRCGRVTTKPAVNIVRVPNACARCSGKEEWNLERVRKAIKGKCILLGDDGCEDTRPGETLIRLNDLRYFRCCYCNYVGRKKKVFGQVKYNRSVCEECNPRKQWNLGRFRKLVSQLGGRVVGLSKKPDSFLIKASNKIAVVCRLGHSCRKSPAHVMSQKTLCLECSSGLYERIVRAHFEAIFGVQFPKKKNLNWLKNPATGGQLELDGFAKKLSLAFEHDGPQHYGQQCRSNQTPQELRAIRGLHKLKDRLCVMNGVTLIRIVSMNKIANPTLLRRDILEKCAAANVAVPHPDANETVVEAPESIRLWEEVRTIVNRRGGRLISRQYLGSATKVKVSCGDPTHRAWEITPQKIKMGRWCPKCYAKKVRVNGAKRHGFESYRDRIVSRLNEYGCALMSRSKKIEARTVVEIRCWCGELRMVRGGDLVRLKYGGLCRTCAQRKQAEDR
jgi:hypothetical protein